MVKKRNEPKHEAIVLANTGLISTLPNLEYNDIEYLTHTCWGCGYEFNKHKPTRCHVIAHSQGGTNDPSNYYLLCDRCHSEQPDGMTRQIQDKWLRNRALFLDDLLPAVIKFVESLRGLTTPKKFQQWERRTNVREIIHQGYLKAAGWRNGRANAFALVRESLEEYLESCPHRRRRTGDKEPSGG